MKENLEKMESNPDSKLATEYIEHIRGLTQTNLEMENVNIEY